MSALDLLTQGDAVSRIVAAILLASSVASWVIILWKTWLLRRASRDVARGIAVFWQAPTLQTAGERLAGFDGLGLVRALVAAATTVPATSLAAAGPRLGQLTRGLRHALQANILRLQFGQVLLATIGSTAPFVGLLGTVWGIHHALGSLVGSGQVSIDQVAGPVGEALVMTAAGLAVAIPAVVAYNVFGRWIAQIEVQLDGFAHDLRELLLPEPAAP